MSARTSLSYLLLSVLFRFLGWGEIESIWYVGHYWSVVPGPDDRRWVWSSRWDENWQGKLTYSENSAPVSLCPPQIP
jgi:hypothetical protein